MITLSFAEGGEESIGGEGDFEYMGSFELVPNPLSAEGSGHDADKNLATVLVSELGGFLFGADRLSVGGIVHLPTHDRG